MGKVLNGEVEKLNNKNNEENVKYIEIDEGIPHNMSLLTMEIIGDDIFITRVPSKYAMELAINLDPQPHQIVMKITKEELLKIKCIRIYFEKIPKVIEHLKELYNTIKTTK